MAQKRYRLKISIGESGGSGEVGESGDIVNIVNIAMQKFG